jgi:hypothetical protein
VLLPSRGRPLRFKECLTSLLGTSENAEVLVYLDDDDPTKDQYPGLQGRVRYIQGPRVMSSKAIKRLMSECDTEYMMFGADDILFKTDDWDKALMQAVPKDGIGFSYGDDQWKNAPGHYCFHRKWYELTGIYPDVFTHFGPDGYAIKVIETLDKERMTFLHRVKIPHLHFRNGKASRDSTYDEERAVGDGRQALQDALRDNLPKDLEILKAYLSA